ncbi:hypothetical protein F5Y15DRAFT_29429 [Xylariaceae sp. FL0016]|nr:hypothetical protein F5Y15DRAFT_29429 [Xylariaceae sp. FL0016]
MCGACLDREKRKHRISRDVAHREVTRGQSEHTNRALFLPSSLWPDRQISPGPPHRWKPCLHLFIHFDKGLPHRTSYIIGYTLYTSTSVSGPEPPLETNMAEFIIPTIDIAPYLADPSSRASDQIVQEVKEACITSGFFQVVNHGIDKQLQDRVFEASKAFFALPLDEKKALKHPALRNRGYEQIGGQALDEKQVAPDQKEGFYVGQHIPPTDERAKKHPELMGNNIFPKSIPEDKMKEPQTGTTGMKPSANDAPRSSRPTVEAYFYKLRDLSAPILEILSRGLTGRPDAFTSFMSDDPVCALRLLHYPAQESGKEKLGAGAHSDFGAITLLLQGQEKGLEVKHGDQWILVEPNPDSYVVNIGDMMEMWTTGTYKSTVHRVINNSGTERYSAPFFVDGRADEVLTPFDVSKATPKNRHPETGEWWKAGQYLVSRLTATYAQAENKTDQS